MTAPSVPFERGYALPIQRLTQGALLLVGLFTRSTAPVYACLALTLAEALFGYEAALAAQLWHRVLRPVLGVDERRGPLAARGETLLWFDPAANRAACVAMAVMIVAATLLINLARTPLGWVLVTVPAASCLLAGTSGFCLGCQVYVLRRTLVALLRGESRKTAPALRPLPIAPEPSFGEGYVNQNCILRRNLAVQPYPRCSYCTLHYRQCYAWQSSVLFCVLIVLALVAAIAAGSWAARGFALAIIGASIGLGLVIHRHTDELLASRRALALANDGLEATVRDRTGELEAANRRLRELDEMKSHFVAVASHELRTPLTSIRGSAENLLDGIAGDLAPPAREYVGIIKSESDRLTTLVADLLDLRQIEVGKIALRAESVRLDEVAREAMAGLEPLAARRRVALALEGPPLQALGDRDRVKQVLWNLVGNAVKFSPEGEAVRVALRRERGRVELRVDDRGAGIPPEERRRVFERFYQVGARRDGTGLGLAIAKALVELMGGTIGVDGRADGPGSSFFVALPEAP